MKVGFLITNPNHHVELTLPVVKLLVEQGHEVSYISLCELRRMHTPTVLFRENEIPFVQMSALPGDLKPSSGSKSLGNNNSLKRRVVRTGFWYLKLRNFIKSSVKSMDKIVLLNDAAFPGNLICAFLKHKNIPFYLMQEGIRFPLPNEVESQYGAMGAHKVLAWGNHSATHFNSVKAKETKVVAVGSPRMDKQYKAFCDAPRIDNEQKVLGLFTNPVDDMGYTDFEGKLLMVRNFFERFGKLLNQHEVHVLIKCHPREDGESYLRVIEEHVDNCSVAQSGINEAIMSVDAGVIMASTVGLELLMAGKKVVQLAIPGHGYVFDYVSGGAAMPYDELQESTLLSCINDNDGRQTDYLSGHFANLGNSAMSIAKELMKP